MLADHGQRLIGSYEVQFCDTEVVTLWGTSLDAHLALQRSRDAALGLDDELVAQLVRGFLGLGGALRVDDELELPGVVA